MPWRCYYGTHCNPLTIRVFEWSKHLYWPIYMITFEMTVGWCQRHPSHITCCLNRSDYIGYYFDDSSSKKVLSGIFMTCWNSCTEGSQWVFGCESGPNMMNSGSDYWLFILWTDQSYIKVYKLSSVLQVCHIANNILTWQLSRKKAWLHFLNVVL